jgi:hypothetical protein
MVNVCPWAYNNSKSQVGKDIWLRMVVLAAWLNVYPTKIVEL